MSQDNKHVTANIHLLLYYGSFSKSTYAFRTQELFDMARDDVLRLCRTPPLLSFLAGWVVACFVARLRIDIQIGGIDLLVLWLNSSWMHWRSSSTVFTTEQLSVLQDSLFATAFTSRLCRLLSRMATKEKQTFLKYHLQELLPKILRHLKEEEDQNKKVASAKAQRSGQQAPLLGSRLQTPNRNLKPLRPSPKPLTTISPTLTVRWNPTLGSQLPGHCTEVGPSHCQHQLRGKPPRVNKLRTAAGNSAMLRSVRRMPGYRPGYR
jgi:hypothetical protein